MPQYQGVWSLQQQMQALTSGQWATDPLFDYTTLLLQADNAANSAQNNTFLDSSTNAFAITRNGNTTQGTFSPFSLQPGAWSNFFNTGYLTVASNAAFDLGSGDATIEAWIYPTSSGQTCGIFDKRSNALNYSQFPQIALSSGALILYVSYSGSSWAVTINGATPAVNAWTHVALVRSGNTWTLYVNGVVSGTPVTAAGSVYSSTDSLSIGASTSGGTNPFAGYISNARIVKGTAVYTSSFNVSAVPLTAITNTSLLTCQANRFLDASANAFTITPNSTYSVQAFSPFAPQFQYTASGTGGSGYFDGTGDYLTAADNVAFEPGTGDFTIEAWVYHTTAAGSLGVYIAHTSSGISFYRNAGGKLEFAQDAVGVLATSTNNVPVNAWTQVAVTRSGTTLKLIMNGAQEASVTNSTNLAGTGSLGIGASAAGTNPFTGYISGLRMLKGTGYSSISIPTAPPTAITNTQLLLNFTNAGILDGTMKNNLETVADAKVSTSVVKYGSGSMYFSGTSPYSYLKGNANLSQNVAFGTGDFTIECWVYLTSTSSDSVIMDTRPGANSANYFLFYLWTSGGTQQPTITWYSPTSYVLSTGSSVPGNTWVHIAVARSNGVIRSFLNGVLQQSAANTTSYANPGAPYPYIGAAYGVGTDSFKGYIDDFRITNGIARYTQNFIPPSVALPRQ